MLIVLETLCYCNTHAIFLPIDMINKALSLNEGILTLAKSLYQKKSLIVMGRGFNFATCLEGALVSQDSMRPCVINYCLWM